jgi:hypothetical protein
MAATRVPFARGGIVTTTTATVTADAIPFDEGGILAGEMVASFGRLVQLYERLYKIPTAEAVERAKEVKPQHLEQILHGRPEEVNWCGLDQIARTDPDRALARWEEIKHAALVELQTGHRSARALETVSNNGPWERAQFLALRTELAAEWQPTSGIERQLVDVMALAQTNYLSWLNTLAVYTNLEYVGRKRMQDEKGQWEGGRQSDAEAIEQAAAMAERFNRIFLRTLRTLADLRRHPPVIVQNAGQVNVGAQQVNVGGGVKNNGTAKCIPQKSCG